MSTNDAVDAMLLKAYLDEKNAEVTEFRMLLGANEGESTVDALHRYTFAVQLGCALRLEQRAKEIAEQPSIVPVPTVREVTVAALIGGATLLRQGVPAASNSPGILDGSDKACAHANRWHAPIGATGFICTDCNERVPDALVARLGASRVTRYPCSPTCTHDDAATPGHPERVKERSEAVKREIEFPPSCPGHLNSGHTHHPDAGDAAFKSELELEHDHPEAFAAGVEAMRAACWEAVRQMLQRHGFTGEQVVNEMKAAIEGAAP